jgi:hypothetical protein
MLPLPSNAVLEQQIEEETSALQRNTTLHDLLHHLKGEPNQLPPFALVQKLKPRSEHYRGMQTIEVDRIVGSVDRYADFDHRFLPKKPHILAHWADLRRKQLTGAEFPPIEVYKVGEVYFVKDGNHRTALAKAEDQEFIDAEVIEVDVAIPPDCCDTTQDLLQKAEYASFLEATHLEKLRPDHLEFRFTVLGRYDKLIEHIHGRQHFMSLEQHREIPWCEAVCDWYDTLYLPAVQTIRDHQMMAEFPHRTESDLYLWVMDYRLLQHRLGITLSVPDATLAYEKQASRGWIGKLTQIWRRLRSLSFKNTA